MGFQFVSWLLWCRERERGLVSLFHILFDWIVIGCMHVLTIDLLLLCLYCMLIYLNGWGDDVTCGYGFQSVSSLLWCRERERERTCVFVSRIV